MFEASVITTDFIRFEIAKARTMPIRPYRSAAIKITRKDNAPVIKEMTGNWSGNQNIKTNFVKPKFGDASGVRGAALLGRNNSI